jgi:hypothetical protein
MAFPDKHRNAAGLKLSKVPTSIQRACGIEFLWEGGQPCFVRLELFSSSDIAAGHCFGDIEYRFLYAVMFFHQSRR